MENGASAPKEKCSIFHNIFRYIFQRRQKALLWSKGLKQVKCVLYYSSNILRFFFCKIILNLNQRSIKDISIIDIIYGAFIEGIMGKHFCENILNLQLWFRRKCRLKIFLIYDSGSPFVKQSETICAIVVKDYEKHFCEIIFNLDQCFRRRCRLRMFLI